VTGSQSESGTAFVSACQGNARKGFGNRQHRGELCVIMLQTLVSRTGFREPTSNVERLAMLDELLEVAVGERADLLVLPGGYLAAETEGRVASMVGEVERRAEASRVAVIGGVDVQHGGHEPKRPGKSGRPTSLPYFAFAVGPVEPSVAGTSWQQTSSTNANAGEVAEASVPGRGRVVTAAGSRVGTLICGELFSCRARQSFCELDLDLVLDLGHESMGTGVTKAMENIGRNGECAVAHSQHVAPWGNASLHFIRAGGLRESVLARQCRRLGSDDFWVAWTVRDI